MLDVAALIDKMDRHLRDLPRRRYRMWQEPIWHTRRRRVRIVTRTKRRVLRRVWLIAGLCAQVAGRPSRHRNREPWNRPARSIVWFSEKPQDPRRSEVVLRTCAHVVNHLYSGDLLDPPPVPVDIRPLPDMPPKLSTRLVPFFVTVLNGLMVTVLGGLLLAWLLAGIPG